MSHYIHLGLQIWGKDAGEYDLSDIDRNMFVVVRVRDNWNCSMCSNTIRKGSYCLGKNSCKICIKCADNFLDKSYESFKKLSLMIKNAKEELNSNKMNYAKNNILT